MYVLRCTDEAQKAETLGNSVYSYNIMLSKRVECIYVTSVMDCVTCTYGFTISMHFEPFVSE